MTLAQARSYRARRAKKYRTSQQMQAPATEWQKARWVVAVLGLLLISLLLMIYFGT